MRLPLCHAVLAASLSVLAADAIAQRTLTAHPIGPTHANATARGSAPLNDDCNGAVPHTLAPGGTVTFSGDNTGATVGMEPPIVDVFEAFTLTACSTVHIDYCSADSVFHNFFTIVGMDCATVYDNNSNIGGGYDSCSVTFIDLDPGTYYIPVLVQEGQTPIGPYSFTATATACVPYCMASALDASQEIISTVTFGTIMNFAGNAIGYDDQTATVMEAEVGGTSPIIIGLSGGNADDVSLVWIDLDRNGTFTAQELVFTSAAGVGPHTGNITIPLDAATGFTRMRIRMQRTDNGTDTDACGDHAIGQVQDYTVRILPGATGITERMGGAVSVFPNPGAGELYVRGPKGHTAIDVLDMAGRLLYSTAITGTDTAVRLDLRGCVRAGSYLLRFTNGAEHVERRIVVY